MRIRSYVVLGACVLMLTAGAAACSNRDTDPADATATETAAGTETASATATPTATPIPGKQLAESLAKSPKYFIYAVGPGDTVTSVADTFDGVSDKLDQDFLTELKTVNKLSGDSLPVGHELAIPLRLPEASSLFQENSIAAALAAGDPKPVVSFLVPTAGLRSQARGLIALYRLELEVGDTPGARGFYAIYSTLDRVGVKAGELDAEANVTGKAFAVAGGSMVDALQAEHADAYVFRQGGVAYAVASIDLSVDGQALSGGLEAAVP